jgi:hypothetical protein
MRMKALTIMLLATVSLGLGCASKPQKASFQAVPGPSNADPELGKIASVSAAKYYKTKPEPSETRTRSARQSKQSTPEKLIVTPESTITGKVVVYNDAGRFVVLNFPIGQMPKIGVRMFVYHNGLKAGTVKISGPQRDDNIVADLVEGEARSGDEVREK